MAIKFSLMHDIDTPITRWLRGINEDPPNFASGFTLPPFKIGDKAQLSFSFSDKFPVGEEVIIKDFYAIAFEIQNCRGDIIVLPNHYAKHLKLITQQEDKEMKFKVGDILICKDNHDNGVREGEKAKIIGIKEEYFAVEFYKKHDFLHNCDGMGKEKRCHFFHKCKLPDLFTLYEADTKPYMPGTEISSFVDGLIKENKDCKDRLKWLKTFKNCVLPKEVKEVIEEAITVVLCNEKFGEWGINDHFEKGLTNSILLYGDPGTGKTMIAESFAAVLGKHLMKIDSAVLQSNIPGQTERNIKKAFKEASEENCVLLFDECDSVLSNREMVGVILSAEINCLLTEIENFNGVVILTTNRLHRLDPALSRRIVAKVGLPRPDADTRVQIWKNLVPPKMPLEDIDFKKLAEYDLSGGEIKNAILLAARKAIAKNKSSVTMQNFTDAVAMVVKSSSDFNKKSKRMHEIIDNYQPREGAPGNGHFSEMFDKISTKLNGVKHENSCA